MRNAIDIRLFMGKTDMLQTECQAKKSQPQFTLGRLMFFGGCRLGHQQGVPGIRSIGAVGTALVLFSAPALAQLDIQTMAVVPMVVPAPSIESALRDQFAASIRTVIGAVGTQVASSLSQNIAHWFATPSPSGTLGATAPAAAPAAAFAAMPAVPVIEPLSPVLPPANAGVLPMLPVAIAAPVLPSFSPPPAIVSPVTAPATDTAQSGVAATPMGGAPSAASQAVDATPALLSGFAYEVHLQKDGRDSTIDPTSFEFHSGDRILVYYRPALPGEIDIFNVDASGTQTRIDSSLAAAGQLLTLGPYEFSGPPLDEHLRIVSLPCTSDALTAMTRSLVKVTDVNATATPLKLSVCGASRSLASGRRNAKEIRKVGSDGTTRFALDPVSKQEQASGQIGPRALTITLIHR